MEVFGKFWSIVIGFILIFICPVYIMEMRLKVLEDIQIMNVTDRFIDKVKYTGYIDRKELDNFYLNMSKIGDSKELNLVHKKRAVRPVVKNGEVVDSREFYVDVFDAEIKESLKTSSKYRFKIGDEICLIIRDKERLLNIFPKKTIEMGGMIENEYIKG